MTFLSKKTEKLTQHELESNEQFVHRIIARIDILTQAKHRVVFADIEWDEKTHNYYSTITYDEFGLLFKN